MRDSASTSRSAFAANAARAGRRRRRGLRAAARARRCWRSLRARAARTAAGAWRDKLSLLRAAARWRCGGFGAIRSPDRRRADRAACAPRVRARADRAALRRGAQHARSTKRARTVFLRVLQRCALFGGRGSADLLLPRARPRRAASRARRRAGWMRHGADASACAIASRADAPATARGGSTASASTASCSRRTAAGERAPGRDDRARRGPTAAARCRIAADRHRLPAQPGHGAARADAGAARRAPIAPAQFVFDRGQLGGAEGLLAFVVSGAEAWVERGSRGHRRRDAAAGRDSARRVGFAGRSTWSQVVTEKRATFRCTPACAARRCAIADGPVGCRRLRRRPVPVDARRRRARPAIAALAR